MSRSKTTTLAWTKNKAVLARFWGKIDKRSDAECWMWTAHRTPTGYGTFRLNGQMKKAHRLAYILANGAIPSGLSVCHSCDEPGCCNPQHLWAGTISQNMRDAFAKGRKDYRGENCPRARLSTHDVLAIRKSNEPLLVLAKRYGVSFAHISSIRRRKTWSHLP